MGSREIHFGVLTIFFVLTSCSAEVAGDFCPGLSTCTAVTPTATPTPYFFSDDFDRSNGSLDAGSDWVLTENMGGSVEIVSNEVVTNVTTVGVATAHHSVIVPQDDVKATIQFSINTVTFSSTTLAVMALLLRNANNNTFRDHYLCGVDEPVTSTSGQLVIYKRVGGMHTILNQTAAAAVPLSNGHGYTLTFSAQGSVLTCTISGSASASISATDDTHTSGYVGFALFNSGAEGEATADNFTVELL